MKIPAEERRTKLYFEISVWLKGLISLAEVIAGILVIAVSPANLASWIISASQDELLEEPGSFIASHVLALGHQFAATSGVIIAVYLLSRGIIKLGLVAALLRGWLWAYPTSLVILGLFIIYQSYEFALGHSPIIAAITVFDLVVVYFIWREYLIVKEHLRVGE
ncbi:MAG TPA: DUF2127 domain-containing protein [Candidatus Paceibacterota bacterium]|nr:DUF2127 domain-containing protein [Candidatus Paceibacterota bacterium]